MVYIAIRTGMRASELLGLEEAQVTPRWAHLWETKNGSARSVPLTDDLHGRLGPLVSGGKPSQRADRKAGPLSVLV